ncbi:uncharacterized protein LOC111251537 isoform X3 [Varroa destructor]|uniref:Trimethylguanosine synthase n=1 Tax=Varroa destructor TaxID=109461 RepID=A0A7M7KAI3_VARDE|nr:uncharacterized protein LOC111251537 isoform X3 [Varroa destructor]
MALGVECITQRSANAEPSLRTVPNIIGRPCAFGPVIKKNLNAFVPSILSPAQKQGDETNEVVEIGRHGLQNKYNQLFRGVKDILKGSRYLAQATQIRTILEQRTLTEANGDNQQNVKPPKDAAPYASLWFSSTLWNQPIIQNPYLETRMAKVTHLKGPGYDLAVRSSPVFVYPDYQTGAITPKFVVYFNMTGGLALAAMETVLRIYKIITDAKILQGNQGQPGIVFPAAAAKAGAYKIVMGTQYAEVFISAFQPEHIGHRGCLAAGFSYFLCGLDSGTPPYRVVATGSCGRTRFVLSRSHAGDCPRLPLFHYYSKKKHSDNNNSAINNNGDSTSNTSPSERMLVPNTSNQACISEKATASTKSTAVKGLGRILLACDVGPDGQLTPVSRSSDVVEPQPFPCKLGIYEKEEQIQQGLQNARSAYDNDTPSRYIATLPKEDVLKQRLQSFCLNTEMVPAECALNCVERKPTLKMLREMAVLLNDKSALVRFDLRTCGLCAPSRALLNDTQRKAILYPKQQSFAGNESKPVEANFACSGNTSDRTIGTSPKVAKYFNQRYRLISRFRNDLHLSEEAWFSICPEEIGKHIARRVVGLAKARGGRPLRIIDPCCGAGGNAVQCATMPEIEHVYANDLEEHEISSARQLAALYGVEHKMTFSCGDLFQLRPEDFGDIDALVFSPPWGGPEYLSKPIFDISEMTPSYAAILRHCCQFSRNMAILLPRNVCLDQLAAIAEDLHNPKIENARQVTIELELNLIGRKCKTATVYYGELTNHMAYQSIRM